MPAPRRRLACLAVLLAGAALVRSAAAPDWAAIEGDLRWPTNFYAARDALLAAHPVDQRLNVRDFGAKGDGVSDDTRPVQRALDAAFSRQQALHFPAGTYRFDTLSTQWHPAFLSIGQDGRAGALVLLGDGQARLCSNRLPPGDSRWPTSPLLRVFAGVTNLLVQGLAFDRTGTPLPMDAAGKVRGNGDHAGGLQLVPGQGQRGFRYVGLLDCEFLNCHHAFSLYPRSLSLDRNMWRTFPTNAFGLVHVADNRFRYTDEFGGTATWFDGVGLLVAENNRFDGQLDRQLSPDPALQNRISNRPSDGWLYGQCEQLWARSNHVRHASFELLGCLYGYRPFELARAYTPGEAIVFDGDLWERQRGGPATGGVPGSAPGWRRMATNYSDRFVHRFLHNVVDGTPVPGTTEPGAYVGLRVDFASLVAVSNRFTGLLEGFHQSGRPPTLESSAGFAAPGSVIRGNELVDCVRGVVLGVGPALVADNTWQLATDQPRAVNDQLWHPVFLRLMEAASGTVARSNHLQLARREASAPTAQRQWQPTPNAAVAFIANNGLHACAHGNSLTGLACGVVQGLWNGSWTLRDNVWTNVVMPWEGIFGNFIADESLPLAPPATGWYRVADLDRTQPGRGTLELRAETDGQPVRYRFTLAWGANAEAAELRAEVEGASTPDKRWLTAAFARWDGALLLHFNPAQSAPATLRFTTALPDGVPLDCATRPVTGIRWRWPAAPEEDVPAGLLTGPPRRDLLMLTNGSASLPLFP